MMPVIVLVVHPPPKSFLARLASLSVVVKEPESMMSFPKSPPYTESWVSKENANRYALYQPHLIQQDCGTQSYRATS